MALECYNCGAFIDVAEGEKCPYCQSVVAKKVENEVKAEAPPIDNSIENMELSTDGIIRNAADKRRRDEQESLSFLATIKPSFDGSKQLKSERAKEIILKVIFYPIAAVMFLAGAYFLLAVEDLRAFDESISFWVLIVPSIVLFLAPKFFKSDSVEKRMKTQLSSDGFEILWHRFVASNDPSISTTYFVVAKHDIWIVWNDSGKYIYHSKFEVAKIDDKAQIYDMSNGAKTCGLFSLVLELKDGKTEQIVLLPEHTRESVNDYKYKDRVNTAKQIRNYLES